jgi:hypothetical protein
MTSTVRRSRSSIELIAASKTIAAVHSDYTIGSSPKLRLLPVGNHSINSNSENSSAPQSGHSISSTLCAPVFDTAIVVIRPQLSHLPVVLFCVAVFVMDTCTQLCVVIVSVVMFGQWTIPHDKITRKYRYSRDSYKMLNSCLLLSIVVERQSRGPSRQALAAIVERSLLVRSAGRVGTDLDAVGGIDRSVCGPGIATAATFVVSNRAGCATAVVGLKEATPPI